MTKGLMVPGLAGPDKMWLGIHAPPDLSRNFSITGAHLPVSTNRLPGHSKQILIAFGGN